MMKLKIIPDLNTPSLKYKAHRIDDTLEIKRMLQGAILGYGLDRIEALGVSRLKCERFVFLEDNSGLDESDVRHLINCFGLSSLVTNKISFEYKF